MKHGLLVSILFTLIACATRPSGTGVESPYRDLSTLKEGQILHLATGRLLTEEQLYANLSHFRVVYVGETHDNVDAHAVQLAILAAIHRQLPGRVAVGMEMLRRPYQSEVDAYLKGPLSEKEFLQVWEESWGPHSYAYYRDLLSFCREQEIPVLALNAGRELEEAVVRDPASRDPRLVARLPELDLDDTYYRSIMEAYFEAHAGGSEQGEIFLRVQALRDEAMAATAAEYLLSPEGVDKCLLVFAGGNHVRYGFGVPRRLFRRVPIPYAVVDTFITEYPEAKRKQLMDVALPVLPLRPADFYWAVGYRDLVGQERMSAAPEAEDASGLDSRQQK